MAWRLAHSLEQLRNEILDQWPGTTIWTIGDQDHAVRNSDHNPNSAGVVCAIDVLGRSKAAVLWDELLASRDPRIKYMIFNRKIVSSTLKPWQERGYNGSNPHVGHIHISVGRGKDGYATHPSLYDSRAPWITTTTPQEDDMPSVGEIVQGLWDFRSKDGRSMEFYQRVGSDAARHLAAEMTVLRGEVEEIAGMDIDATELAQRIAARLDVEIAPGATPQEIVDHLYERLGKEE